MTAVKARNVPNCAHLYPRVAKNFSPFPPKFSRPEPSTLATDPRDHPCAHVPPSVPRAPPPRSASAPRARIDDEPAVNGAGARAPVSAPRGPADIVQDQAAGGHAGTNQVPLADAGVLDGDVPRVGGVADTDVGTDGVSVTDISEADEPSPANEHTPARGDDTNQDAGAALVLKVGGKAEHPTLGNVTILVLGQYR